MEVSEIKFRVVVHGKHFRLFVTKKRWFRREELLSRPVGFYTTRFVKAANANAARDTVLMTLWAELERDGRRTEASILELEEIREDERGSELYGPGGGYTFYSEDDSVLG